MSRPLAPTLRTILSASWFVEADQAEKELRALLAVARALDHMLNEDRNREPGTIHCSWMEAAAKGRRALDKLARVSGPGRKRT